MEHTDNCGRSGPRDAIVACCKLDCVCKCHLEKHLPHGEKMIDGVALKYLCQPCSECKAKLELFARYKKALEDLTPGGSEYVNDPERCAKVIRDRFAGPITILKRQKMKLEAAEELAKVCQGIKDHADLNIALTYRKPTRLYNDLAAVLAAWENAKGET